LTAIGTRGDATDIERTVAAFVRGASDGRIVTDGGIQYLNAMCRPGCSPLPTRLSNKSVPFAAPQRSAGGPQRRFAAVR